MAFTISSMNNNSFSTLFSGMNTGATSGLYGAISDYNSIKSGSYGKLLGAYYKEMGASSSSSSSKAKSTAGTDNTSRGYLERYKADQEKKAQSSANSSSSTVNANSVQKATSSVATSAQSMVDSLDKLRSSDLFKKNSAGNYDTAAITSAVNSFVDAYNSTIENASKANSAATTNSTSISGVNTNVSAMKQYTQSYSKQLSEIGVSIGENGKLSVDQEALKSADMTGVKNLFDKGSYGYSIRTNAYMTNYYAKQTMNNTSTYGNNGAYSMSDLVSTYNGTV